MELHMLLSFVGAAVLLILMPGPDNIFVLTESVTRGSRNGIAVSLGLNCGLIIHTLAAVTGVSIIIQQSAIAFSIVKYLGAGYLFYLAYLSYKSKSSKIEVDLNDKNNETGFFRLVLKGFFMNVLNPKVALFFMALLPQFVVNNGFPMYLQMIILGAVFMFFSFSIFSLIALLAGRLSSVVNNSRFWKITKYTKVSILSLLGIGLALAKK